MAKQYQKENILIQGVAIRLLNMVNRQFSDTLETHTKSAAHDVVTSIDMASDKLLITTISNAFPEDQLLTEESSPSAHIGSRRTWVIDPICGTGNLSRGIRLFVTNIALVENGVVCAAWTIDHSRQRVVWSVGSGLKCGRQNLPRLGVRKVFPIIDFDWGYFYHMSASIQKKYAALSANIRLERTMWTIDTQTSLAFTYIATGQIEGTISLNLNSWDFAAPAFLVEQNGGIVTNFDGSPWSLKSRSLVMAANLPLHKALLGYIKKHGLQKVK